MNSAKLSLARSKISWRQSQFAGTPPILDNPILKGTSFNAMFLIVLKREKSLFISMILIRDFILGHPTQETGQVIWDGGRIYYSSWNGYTRMCTQNRVTKAWSIRTMYRYPPSSISPPSPCKYPTCKFLAFSTSHSSLSPPPNVSLYSFHMSFTF